MLVDYKATLKYFFWWSIKYNS